MAAWQTAVSAARTVLGDVVSATAVTPGVRGGCSARSRTSWFVVAGLVSFGNSIRVAKAIGVESNRARIAAESCEHAGPVVLSCERSLVGCCGDSPTTTPGAERKRTQQASR